MYTVKVRKGGYASAEQEVFVNGKDGAVTVELRPMVKVIFSANGGKFADGKPTQEVEVAKGDRVSPLSKNPERLGFKFTVWFLDGKEYDFTEKVNQPFLKCYLSLFLPPLRTPTHSKNWVFHHLRWMIHSRTKNGQGYHDAPAQFATT